MILARIVGTTAMMIPYPKALPSIIFKERSNGGRNEGMKDTHDEIGFNHVGAYVEHEREREHYLD
jgi:hypothetical protein